MSQWGPSGAGIAGWGGLMPPLMEVTACHAQQHVVCMEPTCGHRVCPQGSAVGQQLESISRLARG